MARKGINLEEKNNMWVGDNVKYNAVHAWVRRRKHKSKICECCNSKPPNDLANINGVYNRDINNYEWLCRSCHMNKDGRKKNLCKGREGYLERECSICGNLTKGNKYCKVCAKEVRRVWWIEYNKRPLRASYRKNWEEERRRK